MKSMRKGGREIQDERKGERRKKEREYEGERRQDKWIDRQKKE